MYIIGDAKCASFVKMWKEVIEILTGRDQLGPTLYLKCLQHQETILVVLKPGDFEILSPEDRCTELCSKRLNYRHSCEFQCHAEVRHRVTRYRKLYERRRLKYRHRCPKQYSDLYRNYNITINNVSLLCNCSFLELAY